MKVIDADGVLLLCHGEHSIQLSPQELSDMRAMDQNALSAFLRGKHVNFKSKTNDALRAIERDKAQIHAALDRFLRVRDPADDDVEMDADQ